MPTIQQAIDSILKQVPAPLQPGTVDTLKFGDPKRSVRGVVVTFMATRSVLQRALDLGANFVITHEPTFYNHRDEIEWLGADDVCASKRKWIEEHDLAIWRFHDGPHSLQPDGIDVGMIRRLGWKRDTDPERQKVFTVPAQTVRALAEDCKKRLGIAQVRVAGDLDATCTHVGLRVGSSGGQSQIELFRDHQVDVVVCGESPEWETCEYVRDAVAMGQKKALIVLGHANSEEAGIEWMAEWIRPALPAEIPINYVPAGDPFRFV